MFKLLPLSSKLKNIDNFLPSLKYARVIKVYDGDTITVAGKTSIFGKMYKFKIRLDGLDTPDMRSNNQEEKEHAMTIRNILYEKIFDKIVKLDIKQTDKYGRYLCDVFYNNININQWLLDNKLAVKYDGGKKREFDKNNFDVLFHIYNN